MLLSHRGKNPTLLTKHSSRLQSVWLTISRKYVVLPTLLLAPNLDRKEQIATCLKYEIRALYCAFMSYFVSVSDDEDSPKKAKKGFLNKMACCGKAEPD